MVSMIFCLQMLLYMAIVVYAPAVALIQGVPKNMFYSNLSLFQYSFDKNFLFKDFFGITLPLVTGFLNGIKYDTEIACGIIFAVCIFYSCIGGIKAVMWTDTFQVGTIRFIKVTVYSCLFLTLLPSTSSDSEQKPCPR